MAALSADVAAMAPGTNTGAAHPVGGQLMPGKSALRVIERDHRPQRAVRIAAYQQSCLSRIGNDIGFGVHR